MTPYERLVIKPPPGFHRAPRVLILRHLYQLGHRRIAFMRGVSHSSDADERWECMMKVMQELRLTIRPEWLVPLGFNLAAPDSGYAPAMETLSRSGQGADQFTALVCYKDIVAIGATRALREHRLRVPEDVSVVGFNDIQAAAFQNPSLTTIRQPLRKMGQTAARILLRRIRGQTDDPDTILMSPELVIRDSTAPPRSLSKRKRQS
jgi:DNA-binding LacI/PurR family transcriptional regulator